MTDEKARAEASQQYTMAHEAHYRAKDLQEALELYRGVMVAHPDTREAEYSRTQIQNIAASLVPRQELLDAQMRLALDHLEHGEHRGGGPVAGTPAAPELSG